MLVFLSVFFTILVGLLSIPILVFVTEVVCGLFAWERGSEISPGRGSRPTVVVLIPAHNEGEGIKETILSAKAQLSTLDRLLVVADNCVDDTSNIAVSLGAEVVVRDDPSKIGKGYALDWGVRQIGKDPRDVIIVLDADCQLSEGAIANLARTCGEMNRPVQGLDLLIAPHDAPVNIQIAEFAWRVKNWVRPLGLKAVGLPCQLMGTGMAFPWDVIRGANLASGEVVEDLKLGLELVSDGSPPVFCPSARVTSYFPKSSAAAIVQRSRWEQGHIHLIAHLAPRFLLKAIRHRNMGLLALVLDLAVPPLSLLVLLSIAAILIAGIGALGAISYIPLVVCTINLAGLVLAVFLCWLKCGRDLLPLGAMFAVIPYVFGKLRIYGAILVRRGASKWVRTERN